MSFKINGAVFLNPDVSRMIHEVSLIVMPTEVSMEVVKIISQIEQKRKELSQKKEEILLANAIKNNNGAPQITKGGQYKFRDIRAVEQLVFEIYKDEVEIYAVPLNIESIPNLSPSNIMVLGAAANLFGILKS